MDRRRFVKSVGCAGTLAAATQLPAGASCMDEMMRLSQNRPSAHGMGYVVLDKDKTFAEQVTQENTIYEIRYDFDLGGQPKEIPAGCVLKFEGGSLKNGIIKGTNTVLSGVSISVDKMAGSFACEIKSSYSSMECNHDKLAMLLSLEVEKVIIDEDYTIAGGGEMINTAVPYIKGIDATISVTGNIDRYVIYATSAKEICGLSFNHNGHWADGSLLVKNKGDLHLYDIKTRGIHNLNPKNDMGVIGLNIGLEESGNIEINRVSAEDLSVVADGSIGESEGQVLGLYIGQFGLQKNDIYIHDVSFKDIITYNSEGKIVLEDGAGMYVHMDSIEKDEYNSSVYIRNVKGVDYGKRLIKADAKNITVDTVDAVQNIAGQGLAVVGLNNSGKTSLNGAYNIKGATVRNVKFRGSTWHVVACAISDVHIENVDAVMWAGKTKIGEEESSPETSITADDTFFGCIQVNYYANNITARNIRAKDCCLLVDSGMKIPDEGDPDNGTEVLVERETPVILSNVYHEYTENGVANNRKTFLNIEHGNVLIENLTATTNRDLGHQHINEGKVVIKGMKLINTTADNSVDWTMGNVATSRGGVFELYDFDIEVRRGLLNYNKPSKIVLKNGTIRVSHDNSFSAVSLGMITCDDTADIAIENVKILAANGSKTVYDIWVKNSSENPLEIYAKNSIASIYSDTNVFWKDTPLTVLGTPALKEGLVRRYTLQGHFTGDFRYVDTGYELISHKSITYAAAQAWSGNTTVPPQVGVQIYLSDKGKTAWWNGSAWVDAMGATIE